MAGVAVAGVAGVAVAGGKRRRLSAEWAAGWSVAGCSVAGSSVEEVVDAGRSFARERGTGGAEGAEGNRPRAGRSTENLPAAEGHGSADKVAVAKLVKGLLSEPYRKGKLTRDEYKRVARAVTEGALLQVLPGGPAGEERRRAGDAQQLSRAVHRLLKQEMASVVGRS